MAELPEGRPVVMGETDEELSKYYSSNFRKYRKFTKLSEGGSAIIETAFDNNLARTVAIKRLHPHLRGKPAADRRFLREARVTATIQHPGTVPVYELGRDDEGHLYFSMKHLVGRDLRDILIDLVAGNEEVLDSFPLQRLLSIVISVCQTVAYAHKCGVIHRDLKPANILVGDFGEVTVLDWGLAKVREGMLAAPLPGFESDVKLSPELTDPGGRYGTLLYMSPEQARGDADIDERTDVYNLGLILFSILTLNNFAGGQPIGQDPAHAVDEILERLQAGTLDRELVSAPGWHITADLEATCMRALELDRNKRHPDVLTLALELQAYVLTGI